MKAPRFVGTHATHGSHHVLFKIEHFGERMMLGYPSWIALLVQDNAKERGVHF
jgi:hypothetical protein